MIPVRISSETSRQFDALKARMARLQSALGAGATTTKALAAADAELAALARDAKLLRVPVRQEIAAAKQRERDDQTIRKAVS